MATAVNALNTVVRCSVIRTADQTGLVTSTDTAIIWQDASTSAKRCYNVGTPWAVGNPTRFTCPSGGDGIYELAVHLWWDAVSSAGERQIAVPLNGNGQNKLASVNHAIASTNGRLMSLNTGGFVMVAGDYVEVTCFHDSGSNRTIVADQFGSGFQVCRATFTRIGA